MGESPPETRYRYQYNNNNSLGSFYDPTFDSRNSMNFYKVEIFYRENKFFDVIDIIRRNLLDTSSHNSTCKYRKGNKDYCPTRQSGIFSPLWINASVNKFESCHVIIPNGRRTNSGHLASTGLCLREKKPFTTQNKKKIEIWNNFPKRVRYKNR